MSRRVSASTTTECTAAMRSGSARARCSATIVGRSSRIACDEGVDRSAPARSPRAGETDVRVSAATRSASSTTPSDPPGRRDDGQVADRRGRACPAAPARRCDRPTPCTAGAVMAAATGSSGDMPSAITRVRRSRSVRIPSPIPPPSTTTHVAPAAVIRCAASRIVVSGAQTTSGRRTSACDGLVGRVGRLLAGRAQAPAIQQRARQEAQRLGPSERRRARRRPGCGRQSCPRARAR